MASYQAYLRIDGIKGESQVPRHVGEIEIHSYSFGPNQRDKLGGSVAGDWVVFDGKQIGDLFFTKDIDRTSADLSGAAAVGNHFATMILTLEQALPNGSFAAVYTLVMADASVSSYQTGGTGKKGSLEHVSINAATMYMKTKAT